MEKITYRIHAVKLVSYKYMILLFSSPLQPPSCSVVPISKLLSQHSCDLDLPSVSHAARVLLLPPKGSEKNICTTLHTMPFHAVCTSLPSLFLHLFSLISLFFAAFFHLKISFQIGLSFLAVFVFCRW